jgi:hypothetical protein
MRRQGKIALQAVYAAVHIVRANWINEGRYSIGLHASHLIAKNPGSTPPRRERSVSPAMLWTALLLMVGLLAASFIF